MLAHLLERTVDHTPTEVILSGKGLMKSNKPAEVIAAPGYHRVMLMGGLVWPSARCGAVHLGSLKYHL